MTRRMRIEDLTNIAVPEQPTLSPDAFRIVYVLRTFDADENRTRRQLWTVEAGGHGEPRPLTHGNDDTSPTFSPDGTQLAFLRTQGDRPQIWLLPDEWGEPQPVTDLPLGAGAPVWSADGAHLAFAAPVDLATQPSDDTVEPGQTTSP